MDNRVSEPRARPRPYKYVQRMRDRYGVWRHYLRKPGMKRVALAGLYGSEEFAASYRTAMAGGTALPYMIGANRTVAGTLNQLIVAYKLSAHWESLEPNSQRNLAPIMEKLRIGPWGGVMVRDIGQKHVRRILDDVAGGHAKRHWLRTLRGLFVHAVETDMIESDPSIGIKIKIAKSDGYHTWGPEEIARYRAHWPLGTEARLVFEFAYETVSRRTEVRRLGRQHIKDGRIEIKRCKGSDDVNILVSPALAAAIKAMPTNEHLTYLVAPGGAPYTPDALGKQFREWATEAGLPSRCRLHGLKKAGMAQMAANGVPLGGMMAHSGHKSVNMVQRYIDKFNRRQAADVASAIMLKTS